MKLYASRKSFLFFTIVLLSQIAAEAQDRTLQSIRQQFDQGGTPSFYEKLYVHTDKTIYLAGELIWFKVYQTNGFVNQPINISRISYVEILSSDKKPVLQAKIGMNSGSGNGSFLIPPSVQSGNFILRAYTNWMKNFSASKYFEKQITIINTLKRPDWQLLDTLQYSVQFFPEGGNLVQGLKSKVGFRITDQFGRGIDCIGAVIDQNNDTISNFKTARFGIGHFVFSPQHGNTYKANIAVNNTTVIKDLPTAYDRGYVMTIVPSENEQMQVVVNANTATPNQSVYLLIHQSRVIKLALVQPIQHGFATFNIAKNDFHDGISYLTLFDGNGQPICERLYFKRPRKKLQIAIEMDHRQYETKEQVKIQLHPYKDSIDALTADMSVSVFLVDSLQRLEQDDIFSYFWLVSEFNGNIESPEYYCSNSGNAAEEDLDNLMLTHGWRKFNWKDTSYKEPTLRFLPEYEGHFIQGTVSNKKGGTPKSGTTAFLSIPGERFQFSNSISDEEGHISFIAKDFFGAGEIIVQTDHTKDNSLYIGIASPFSKSFSSRLLSPFHVSELWKNHLVSRSIGTQAQNLFLADSIRQFFLPTFSDTTAFYGKPDKQYLLDDYTRFVTMEEVMREFVTEVQVRKRGDLFHFQVLNSPYKKFFEEQPLLLLDGVPFFDVDKMVSFDPLKIKKIEVVTQRYYYGPMVYYGIVSCQTYEGDLVGFPLDPAALVVEYEGLQLKREFYSPVYEADNSLNNRLPDFRNVLYWSPEINCDENGRGALRFYTSEIPGTYAIVVQGITADGYAGTGISTFLVAEPAKK